jgi:multiple sugar transport system substrate-binding protein
MKLTKAAGPMAVAGVVASVLLSACSNDSATSSGEGTPSGTLQMTYWGSSSRVDKYNKINALFQQKYPGTTVQASSTDFASYFDKLNVQAASRSMPCVTTMQTRQLNDYTTNGTMADLGPLVDAGKIDVSQIPKNVLDTGRGPDGKLYMIPFGVAWNAIAVNTAMAKQHGIEPLPAGYTWDQYGAWLKDSAAKLPQGVQVTDDQGMDEPVFSAYVISNGYTMFGQDGKIGFPKSVLADYWTKWQQWSKAGYTSSPQQNADEPTQLEQFDVTLNKVMSEAIAGNALPGIQKANPSAEMGTMLFGSGKAGLGNMFFVSGYSIPTSCSDTATAAAYINFWTNDDASAKIFASDNGAVANQKQLQQQIADPASPGVKTVLQQYQTILEAKVPTQTIPSGYNAVFEQAFRRDYQDVQFGRKTVDQAVDAFFTEANGSLGAK